MKQIFFLPPSFPHLVNVSTADRQVLTWSFIKTNVVWTCSRALCIHKQCGKLQIFYFNVHNVVYKTKDFHLKTTELSTCVRISLFLSKCSVLLNIFILSRNVCELYKYNINRVQLLDEYKKILSIVLVSSSFVTWHERCYFFAIWMIIKLNEKPFCVLQARIWQARESNNDFISTMLCLTATESGHLSSKITEILEIVSTYINLSRKSSMLWPKWHDNKSN